MWTLKFVFPAVCLESCPLLAGYNLLSKAHMQNIQNISEITQKSKLCQRLCCPSQAWLEAEFQTERIFRFFTQDVEFTGGFLYCIVCFLFKIVPLLCISCWHGSPCSVTFPLQRKLLLLEILIFLSHQALLVPGMNRLWIKSFIYAPGDAFCQQTELFSGQVEQIISPCSEWHQQPLGFCLQKAHFGQNLERRGNGCGEIQLWCLQ